MPDLFNQTTSVATSQQVLTIDMKAKDLLRQLDWVMTQHKKEYVLEILALRHHTSKQVRRKAALAICNLGKKSLISEILGWQLIESDRQTWLLLESAVDKINRRLDTISQEKTERIYSVSEVVGLIKNTVSEKVYTIEGELSEVRLSYAMYYFALKDKQDTRLDCRALVSKIQAGNFPLNEGLTLRVVGKFNLTKNGRLIFEVKNLQLTGQGELIRNLRILETKLESEGLFASERKRPLPKLPRKILLMTSENGAAIGDFTKTLRDRIGGVEIYFLPILTQGASAEVDILEKLEIAKAYILKLEIETVVITRGGGSSDDLWVFNSEKIVRSVGLIPKPVIAAIGHERDITLVEKVADQRASTPSKAASIVSLSRQETSLQVKEIGSFLDAYFQLRSQEYINYTKQITLLIQKKFQMQLYATRQQVRKLDLWISQTLSQLKFSTQNKYQTIWLKISHHLEEIRFNLPNVSKLKQQKTEEIKTIAQNSEFTVRQIQALLSQEITAIKQQVNYQLEVIKLFDPKSILKKGYALIWQKDRIIEKSSDFDTTSNFVVEFSDEKKLITIDE